MKKIIFFAIIVLASIGAVYKMDIKPQVKDVVKQVSLNKEIKPSEPVKTAPAQAIPEQDVTE